MTKFIFIFKSIFFFIYIYYFSCNSHLSVKLFSFRRTVKNIPKYAPAQFYIDNVLPRIKEKKIMALKPFVDRLGLVMNFIDMWLP